MKKIGVLTGGGDAPGLNAVIRAVVKIAHNNYGCEALGIRNGPIHWHFVRRRLFKIKAECRPLGAALGFGAMASFIVRGGMP